MFQKVDGKSFSERFMDWVKEGNNVMQDPELLEESLIGEYLRVKERIYPDYHNMNCEDDEEEEINTKEEELSKKDIFEQEKLKKEKKQKMKVMESYNFTPYK